LRLNRILVAFVACGLAACASTQAPVSQTIHVETPGCKAASCVLSNDLGSWRVERTPGDVAVLASREPLRAVCSVEGGGAQSSGGAPASQAPQGHSGAAAGMAVGTAVGLALGGAALAIFPPLGLIAISTSALAGTAGGSVADASRHAYTYPEEIRIELACGPVPQGAVAAGLPPPRRVGVAFRGLTAAESGAAGIGERGAVLVTGVAEGSVAAGAGLRGGDIVLAAGGQPINDAADLERVVLGLPAGTALELQVWRDRRALDLTLAWPKATP
jgi:hypothetical protein